MGSVNIWTVGDILTVRTFKSLGGTGLRKWANTYELRVNVANTSASEDCARLATVLSNWERQVACNDAFFDRAVVSTYVPDGEPYDPSSFVSVPLGAVQGLRTQPSADSQPLALESCLRLNKVPSFGRYGSLLLRRSLYEGEVQAPNGQSQLTGEAASDLLAALNAEFFGINGDPGVNTLQGWLDSLGVTMVMASGSPSATSVRTVGSIVVSGITNKKLNNKYFDKV